MLLILFICIIFFVVALVTYGIHQFILDKRYELPPGPPPLPFIGNALWMAQQPKSWIVFSELAKKYGPIVTFYLGQYRMIVLNSSDVIKEAICTQGRTFSDRPTAILPGFENYPTGVLFSSGAKWQRRRRFCLKALRDFGMGKMAMVDKIHDEVDHFLVELGERTFRPFNPQRLLASTVSNVICSLVFGKRFNYDDAEFLVFFDTLQKLVTRPFSRRAAYFALPFLRYLKTPNEAAEGLNLMALVEKMAKASVDEHRKDFSPDNIRDFPDLFIREELTEDGLDMESFCLVMVDMFAAGTETTATALNWTLLYLSINPDLQRRCQDTIDRVIDTDRLPTLDDRPRLNYVDAVMCEVLRLATIVPMALFHCNMREKATVATYDIPEKSLVVYNVWNLHHDDTYWTEPNRFNPDRWIDSNGKLLTHSSHFMPFGAGPRICLGEQLARAEYFVFLVSLLQRFNFALADANVSLDDGVPGITYAPPKYRLIASKR